MAVSLAFALDPSLAEPHPNTHRLMLLFSLSIYPAIISHFFPKRTPSRIRIFIRCHKPLFCALLSHGFPYLAQSGDIRCTFPIIVSAVCIHNSCCPLFQQCCDSFYCTVSNIRLHLHHRLPLKKQLAKQIVFAYPLKPTDTFSIFFCGKSNCTFCDLFHSSNPLTIPLPFI